MFNVFVFSAIFGLSQTLVVKAGVVEPSFSLGNLNILKKDNENSLGDESFNIYSLTEYVKDDKDCPTLDVLIGEGGEFLVNTTKIFTGTIHAFYTIFSNNSPCRQLTGFRCFLRKYHEFGITIVDVGEKVSLYKYGAMKFIRILKDYFGRCKLSGVKNEPKRNYIM